MQRRLNPSRHLPHLLAAALLLAFTPLRAQPSPAADAAFAAYTQSVERRLAGQHATTFLTAETLTPEALGRLHHGDLLLDHLTPPNPATGTQIHHWRGTLFVPGATAAAFTHLLRDLPAYPRHFAPEVLRATLLSDTGDHLQTTLRVRQHHVLTVTLDTAYDITFTHPNSHRGTSTSRSTHIAEIADAGTPSEHPLSPADEHGFLYRLNTYWTWEEREDGLYLQIETVSLSRAIPTGLTWALRPFVDSIPRDSLTFTLTSARKALAR